MLLITGANGQLGTELSELIPDAIAVGKNELDITDSVTVKDFVKEHNIRLIINCAAYTAVDKAEDEKDLAEKINVVGPKNLAQSGAIIVHISTDYVFDGRNYKPYEPNDTPNPLSVYGKTKLAGEFAVWEYAVTALIIRTAWLYSTHGKNFVKTIKDLSRSRSRIDIVDDQIGSPTFARDLAKVIVKIIPQIRNGQKDIYHFTNEGVCSWYDFAKEIVALSKEKTNLSGQITHLSRKVTTNADCEINPISSKNYKTKASRPFYSVLSKEKIKRDFGLVIPHWKDGLIRCLSQF